jgi:hypothetical protein
MPLFPSTPPNIPPPMTPPTPSLNNDSQYSSDYNDEWDRYMNDRDSRNVTRRRPLNQSTPLADDDDFIQGRELLLSDLNGPDSEEEEEEESSDLPDFEGDEKQPKPWANKEMPSIPSYPKQIIDVDAEGFDPFLMDNQKISDYIKEDTKENVVILYNEKYYLTTRAIIDQQEDEALVYECLEGDKKRFENVVGNLPLYNLKKIGINISSDNAVGVEPEYIYMDGINELLTSEDYWSYYSIIPLPDKMLVSVISKNEALKIGTDLGSGVSALHCQVGQGGLPGVLVKAYPNKEVVGGRKGRKTKRTLKKHKRSLKKKSRKSRKTMKRKGKKTLKKRKS